LLIREYSLQPVDIEGISNELFVSVDKKLVAFKTTEPLDPPKMATSCTSMASTSVHVI
jgi:hypothetical protein